MYWLWASKDESPIEGVPMVPGKSRLLGHLRLLGISDDFRVVQHKFSVEHADSKGRCTFYMGRTTPSLSLFRAEDVQLALKATTHRNVFSLMVHHMDECIGKHNLAILTGKEWKVHRNAVTHALHGAGSFDHHASQILKTTNKLVIKLNETIQDSGETTEQECMPMDKVLKCWAMDVFGMCNLSRDFGCIDALEPSHVAVAFDFLTKEMMARIFNGMADPTNYFYQIPTAKNARVREERDYLKGYVKEIIQQRKEALSQSKEVPQDLLTRLITVSLNVAPELRLQEEETLVDVLLSLLLAGHETTTVTMTYALYLLSQHPHVEKKCLEEINAVKEIQESNLPYCRAVITETLRLYPPAISTTRNLDKPLDLGDVVVPEGTYVYIPIWFIHRDEEHFPQPDTFEPRRWVDGPNDPNDSPEESSIPKANDKAFVAFSAGARSCPGQRFAMQEMTLGLALLIKHFHFIPPSDYLLEPYRTGIVQKPKHGMPLKIERRNEKSDTKKDDLTTK